MLNQAVTLTGSAVAHGGDPQDRAASPNKVEVATPRKRSHAVRLCVDSGVPRPTHIIYKICFLVFVDFSIALIGLRSALSLRTLVTSSTYSNILSQSRLKAAISIHPRAKDRGFLHNSYKILS